MAEANRAAANPDDTRRATANNLDVNAAAQAKLFEPSYVFRWTDELENFGDLTRSEEREWNRFAHGGQEPGWY